MKAGFRKTVPILHEGTPQKIRVAVTLFVAVWVVEVFFVAHMARTAIQRHLVVSPDQRLGATTLVVVIGGWLVLKAGLTALIAFRQNWARYVQLLVTVCSLTIQIASITSANWTTFIVSSPLHFANVAATLLLFVRPVNAWFGRTSVPSA